MQFVYDLTEHERQYVHGYSEYPKTDQQVGHCVKAEIILSAVLTPYIAFFVHLCQDIAVYFWSIIHD